MQQRRPDINNTGALCPLIYAHAVVHTRVASVRPGPGAHLLRPGLRM